MISQATIEKFQLGFNLSVPAYPGLADKLALLSKVGINNISYPQILQGTYTPANDYLYLGQNIPPESSPNFFFLMCPSQINITVTGPVGYMVYQMPIIKNFLWFLPKPNTYPVSGIFIEGRTANILMPMAQGVAVDYFCIFGQADIS